MTDKELIARLRDTADHARFEPHLHHAAADRIEEHSRAFANLQREYDKRGDRIEALVRERDEALGWLSASQGYIADAVYALDKQEKAEARAERLEAALREILEKPRNADLTYAELFAEVVSEARAALKGEDHE